LGAHKICKTANAIKVKDLQVASKANADLLFAFAEGLGLSNYQFLKYFSDSDKRKNSLESIVVVGLREQEMKHLNAVVSSTYIARSLVNEPLSYLTAEQYGHDILELGEELGFSVEVFNKSKIQSLKMGGLLAVNLGSPNPPTFSIMEYKPNNAKNEKPYVLMGKGVVYDTGGVSLKPTANSMDYMKCDMGGSAAVVGAMAAIVQAQLPIHIVGLVPATENRPGGNAYVPGDVIHMYNGMTVEVLNTDAEGRMIMADALAYARKYDPELVIDLATLTGAAARAIGDKAIVSMGNAPQEIHDKLIESGFKTYERLAQFPFWDEYKEDLKSRVADIKNLGGPEAGMITAGKFLEYFTKDPESGEGYPYIHLDIAGPAFNHSEKNYRGIEGTGVGVRTLFDFFKNL
jgi:leucyl aminopeptidase